MRPLTIVLCALALAVGTAVVVALLVRPPDPPAVQAIELLPGAATVTPTPTTFAPPRTRMRTTIRSTTMSSRTRIVLSIAVLFAFATAVSTLALRQVLLARVDARIEAALAQEVRELQTFAAEVRTGDVRTLFDQFLARDVPDEAEASFTFVGEQPYRSTRTSAPAQQLIDGVRELSDVDGVERGDIDDDYRYVAVPVNLRGERRGTFVVTADLGHERAEVAEAVRVAGGIGFGMVRARRLALAWVAVGRILRAAAHAGLDGAHDRVRRRPHAPDRRARQRRHRRARAPVQRDARPARGGVRAPARVRRPTPGTSCARRSRSSAATWSCSKATRRAYRIVADELDRMSRFVEDLLTLAKSERPDFLMLSELDLDLLTEELMAKATRLGAREWTLEATGAGLLRGDRQRLTQAVMNLAHNAVQHTQEGDAIALGSSHEGDTARIWVADSGPGVRRGGPRADLRALRPLRR